MEPKSNHRANVVRIAEIKPIPDATNIGLVEIGGYQVVVRLADWKVGDLGVYIQPDSLVPVIPAFDFLWKDKEFLDGIVPDKYRRITVRRFRKQYSEGLLMPLSDFTELQNDRAVGYAYAEGEDLAGLLGITHYEPPEPAESTSGANERGPQYKRFPKSLRGWFWFLLSLILGTFGISIKTRGLNEPISGGGLPVYDVEALKNFSKAFVPGEDVIVTEKIHGSNGRFIFRNGKMYAGSRKLWKSPKSNCVWRKALEQLPWIEEWCRNHEGYALYGEVVPTQKNFDYGTSNGQVKFFVFDILSPEEEWIDIWTTSADAGLEIVPLLYRGGYDEAEIKKLVDGKSHVADAKHIREGIVLRPSFERHVHGLGRLQLKVVSNKFLEVS